MITYFIVPVVAARILMLAPVSKPAPPAPADNIVAVIVRLEGSVRVERDRQSLTAVEGMRLYTGDRVVVTPPDRAVLLHHGGRIESLSVTQVMEAEPGSGARTSRLFAQTISTLAQVARTDPKPNLTRQAAIRPIPGSIVGISPRNDIVVRPAGARFTWFAVPGSAGYRIQIRAEDGSLLRFETGPDTVWLPPSNLQFRAGYTYTWTVADQRNGRPAAPLRFRVLDVQAQQRLDETLGELTLAESKRGDSALLRAILYQEEGMLYDAYDALRELSGGSSSLDVSVQTMMDRLHGAVGDAEVPPRTPSRTSGVG
jgi:hypothetical protein